MPPTDRPRAYTVDAAAELVGVSKRTMYRMIDEGAVDTVSVSASHTGNYKVVRVTEESLIKYLDTKKIPYEIVNSALIGIRIVRK
jgi:predicted site-specific integrase-resolvase